MKTRLRQLRYELRQFPKDFRTIAKFTTQICAIYDVIMSIGDLISHRDLIDVVIEALSE